jgi:hypothetical protein
MDELNSGRRDPGREIRTMSSDHKLMHGVALGGLLVVCSLTAMAREGTGSHGSLLRAFYRVGVAPDEVYSVSDLTLQKDNMRLQLKNGIVFLVEPLDGEVTGAVFIGSGLASMQPVNGPGRYMLAKYYGREELAEPFDRLYLRFSDGTEKRISDAGVPHAPAGDELEQAGRLLRERNGWLDGSRAFALEVTYLESRLSRLEGSDFFLAAFHSAQHDWLTFVHDSTAIQENSLFAYGSLGSKSRAYRIPWTVWHTTRDYSPQGHYLRNPDNDGPRLLRIKHNEMEIDLRDTQAVRWSSRLLVEPLVSNMNTLTFDLANNGDYGSHWYDQAFNPVQVEEVTDVSGQALRYIHHRDRLMVFLPRPTEAATPVTLEVRGRAEVVYQLTAESFGLLQVPWYPQYGYLGGRSSFDWTVRVPRPYLISGSGTITREYEDKENNQNVARLQSDIPVTFPWVIFGRFVKAEDQFVSQESGRTIPITMHSFPTMTVPITEPWLLEWLGQPAPITLSFSAPRSKVEQFFHEGKEALKLYEKIYGAFPYEQLHLAQMAPQLTFGQAPPGFVQLSGLFFFSQAKLSDYTQRQTDFVHGLFAHEIAHQWWGNQIGWASGDDEWLSESFAEYASGIFVNEYQGAKRFQDTLKVWREKAANADREAPIVAADTLRGPNAQRHRTELLYSKGPYVLHMLRIQLDDEKYMKVMRSVQEKYRHRSISTEQLLAEINRVSGTNYTYFFDQWFWDVGIPKFRYSWRSEEQPDGRFLITVHVSQEDKEHLKQVLMPIHIHFKKQTVLRYMPVVEAEQDLRIFSPLQPEDVTLDDERTLLAEFQKQG